MAPEWVLPVEAFAWEEALCVLLPGDSHVLQGPQYIPYFGPIYYSYSYRILYLKHTPQNYVGKYSGLHILPVDSCHGLLARDSKVRPKKQLHSSLQV